MIWILSWHSSAVRREDSWFVEVTCFDRIASAKVEVSSPQALVSLCPSVRSPLCRITIAAFTSRSASHIYWVFPSIVIMRSSSSGAKPPSNSGESDIILVWCNLIKLSHFKVYLLNVGFRLFVYDFPTVFLTMMNSSIYDLMPWKLITPYLIKIPLSLFSTYLRFKLSSSYGLKD